MLTRFVLWFKVRYTIHRPRKGQQKYSLNIHLKNGFRVTCKWEGDFETDLELN